MKVKGVIVESDYNVSKSLSVGVVRPLGVAKIGRAHV